MTKLLDALEDELKNPKVNRWIAANDGKLYYRFNKYRNRLELATIEIYDEGKGICTSVVQRMRAFAEENKMGFIVENVLNPTVQRICERQGMRLMPHDSFTYTIEDK